MKNIAGAPGTVTGLILRVIQCCFAAGSIVAMSTSRHFYYVTAFCYLIASMSLQVIWSSTLASLDAYSIAQKKIIHNHFVVSFFVVGDWVIATLSLAAAASSAGITVLYFSDLGDCGLNADCAKFELAVALAFMSWITIAISSLIMFWILAAN
ncbi:hypothetical protein Leryth_020043 [Lithospermum erythrorhizon]|uniref:CASP-like protein n=1 Tax=Lithospermum erythrorhizon TaxID=34254 RepID=A0AAV3Q4A1_LITER|nr:hypothetical protein Leryth_020043 [Lithospermum erythrorhizon]